MSTNPEQLHHRGFLVELYVDALALADLPSVIARARKAAEAPGHGGAALRYVRSIVVPLDETCFHVFEAASAAQVQAALAYGGIDGDRVTDVLLVDAASQAGVLHLEPVEENAP